MVGPYSPQFMRSVNFSINEETGVLSLDREDDGNWTGGVVGKGDLVGSKWGISAASYPQLDIAALKREDAVQIYWRDFWKVIQGDNLAPRLSIIVLDCAINQSPAKAVRLLQGALTIPADGVMGPLTISAARSIDQDILIPKYQAYRALDYVKDRGFAKYGKGWMVRLMNGCIEATH